MCSTDDEDRYGPVLHETRFGDAVDRDLLSDYRVIVLTVPESLAAGIRNFAEGTQLSLDEQGKMIGCLRALAKTDADQFPDDDRTPMRRAIAFCNLVKSSQRLEERIHDVAEAYAETYGNGHAPAVSARHVDGTFNASARGDALAFLEETPEGETRILTNARCLTEGVDVPALDGILFMHPRKSQIEVVQAVGRVSCRFLSASSRIFSSATTFSRSRRPPFRPSICLPASVWSTCSDDLVSFVY